MTDLSNLPEFPGERITQAKVRRVEHPSGVTFALITLDNGEDHTKPNTMGPGGLKSLAAALEQAEAADVDAIVLTGKPFWFVVGADTKAMQEVRQRDELKPVLQAGHAVMKRLMDGPKPTFAFVNGAAMGGGLELALSCRYRTLSTGVPAISLPEVLLGLVPAWGGTFLTPNLVGADAAVQIIVQNALNNGKPLKATQAFDYGLADAMFEPADFLERSFDWAVKVLRGEVTVERREVDRGPAWDDAVRRGREFADAKVRGGAPAPYRALDLIALAKTASRDEAFAAEDDAGADLVMTEELRAGLYAFDLAQRRAKKPVGFPDRSLARPVTKVGVVGAGLMASQLALLFAQRLEVPVVMNDLDQARIDKGLEFVRGEIDKLLLRGRINQDKANRLRALVTGSLTKEPFADADFVIEAVFEDMKVKRQVFAEVEAVVPETCVLATNTSSLSITEMAAELEHPERVVGFHFFNPVAVMPLLEVVRAERTDDATLATAFNVGKQLKKSMVLVKDARAFVANRLFMRFFNEVTRAIDEGTPVEVADHALDPLGLPMTPLTLLSFTGPAVSFHVMETLHQEWPDRFYLSDNLRRVVEAGKKSFLGADGNPDPEVLALYETSDAPRTAEQVLQAALDAMADEVRRLLDEGVVAEPQDVDLALILGGGYPMHLGGITPYLDRTGSSERVTGKRFLAKGVASLP